MTFHRWYTRLGSIGVDNFAPRVDTRFAWRLGRCRQRELRLPLTRKWTLQISTKGKDYLTLVDGPRYLRNLNWIIDEFDSSFNDLACASLRYHLDWSVCDNRAQRTEYEDLIARLQESSPQAADDDDEREILDAAFQFPLNEHQTPESKALTDRYRAREDAWHERQLKARHDFVDIMFGLWS